MGSNVPIFLSIVNKFHNFITNFDRATSIIAFGGKIKIVNFFKQLDFQVVPLRSECKIHRHYYSKSQHPKYGRGKAKKSKRETTSFNFVGLLSVMVCHFFLKMTLQPAERISGKSKVFTSCYKTSKNSVLLALLVFKPFSMLANLSKKQNFSIFSKAHFIFHGEKGQNSLAVTRRFKPWKLILQ